MSPPLRYASRVARLPLLDSDGAHFGHVTDVVIAPSAHGAPHVLGFVTLVQRRHIFVNANRVAAVDAAGVQLRSGTIDLRPFRKREGEILALGDLQHQAAGGAYVLDIGIRRTDIAGTPWVVETVAIGGRGPLARRRAPRIVPWTDVAELFAVEGTAAEIAEFRHLRPADMANRLRALPLEKRRQLAEIMDDERLADLLEELPEAEQVAIVAGLDLERAADVLEEMEPDDAADLLGELSETERDRLLEAMEPEDADPVRLLLSYGAGTAGGLMTSDPLIMLPTATVAEALAHVRVASLPVTLAAQVFVVEAPISVPTGRFRGTIGVQRLLRHPPSDRLVDLLPERSETLRPDTPSNTVAGRLAAYDMVAMAVCDEADRFVGAVTIDDVLDHMLPVGWRRRALATSPHLPRSGA